MELDDAPVQTPREKVLRAIRRISSWNGDRKDGEWIPESSATDVKRKFERHTRNDAGEVVKQEVEEVVYMHGGYRPKFEGEKKTRKAFFFRGARVWRK